MSRPSLENTSIIVGKKPTMQSVAENALTSIKLPEDIKNFDSTTERLLKQGSADCTAPEAFKEWEASSDDLIGGLSSARENELVVFEKCFSKSSLQNVHGWRRKTKFGRFTFLAAPNVFPSLDKHKTVLKSKGRRLVGQFYHLTTGIS